jgi:23S rRNA (cytosine1962-C5)-methyltransferase
MKFVAREIRRGNKYDIIIMDPPSYGRGPGGEVWKLENEIYGFVDQCKELLTDDSLAVLINSYTAGVSPAVMSYILNTTVAKRFGGRAEADEIGLPVTTTGLVLPCGSTAVWTK